MSLNIFYQNHMCNGADWHLVIYIFFMFNVIYFWSNWIGCFWMKKKLCFQWFQNYFTFSTILQFDSQSHSVNRVEIVEFMTNSYVSCFQVRWQIRHATVFSRPNKDRHRLSHTNAHSYRESRLALWVVEGGCFYREWKKLKPRKRVYYIHLIVVYMIEYVVSWPK